MADEQQDQAAPPVETDLNSPDFDWGKYFLDNGTETAQDAPPPEPQAAGEEVEEPNEVELLRKQLADLTATVEKTAKTTTQIETQNRITMAVQAWEAQASPAELEMKDVLLSSTDPESLQKNAELIKRVTAKAGETEKAKELRIRQQVERELQAQFGLPVTPTFQPIPEKEKMEQALAENNLDEACAIATKGLFH